MSKRYLLIAEKPSAMRAYRDTYNKHKQEIESAIDGTIDFFAISGHLYRNCEPKEYDRWDKKWAELYEDDLPMIPDVWKIGEIPRAKNLIDELKKKLKNGYDGLIDATDSDIEGYGIFYMIAQALNLERYPTLRFYETNLSDEKILESFLTMEDLYSGRHLNATNSYIFRSRWDWLIGMNFSTAYTVRYGELMRVGSVKAPTLKLIYDNCMAIDNFTEKTDYAIQDRYKEGFDGIMIDLSSGKQEVRFETRKQAEDYIAKLGKKATVISFDKQTVQTRAPKLYSLSALQIDASRIYGYEPNDTLETAQSLYEIHKVLSYPRTSGTYISSGQAKGFDKILRSLSTLPEVGHYVNRLSSADIEAVKKDKNVVNDVEVSKAAHDALIPTGEPVPWAKMNEKEKNVFMLVCKRFLSPFLPPLTEEKTTLIAETNDTEKAAFKSNGKITLDQGYTVLYGKKNTDIKIPAHNKGDVIDIEKFDVVERTTKPPKRYTTGTIIDAMVSIGKYIEDPVLKKQMKESEGIGTEATRGQILKDLEDSGYIRVQRNAIYITDSGISYVEHLRREKEDGSFDYGIADPVKIAYWSAKGNEIRLGMREEEDVMEEFISYMTDTIQNIKSSGAPEKHYKNNSSSGENDKVKTCPLCGGNIISGPYGYFCSNRKTNGCKLSIPNEIAKKKLTEGQKNKLAKNQETAVIKGFTNKDGYQFDAALKLNPDTGRPDFVFPKKK